MAQLPLPLSPHQLNTYVIPQAMSWLGSGRFDSPAARVMMVAIALQESGLSARRQRGGPARGLWQFERGGVAGVLSHATSATDAKAACKRAGVAANPASVCAELEFDDVLAAVFARLLLWTDSAPLPALGDADAAWAYYLRNWRPGRPRPETWVANYAAALKEVS